MFMATTHLDEDSLKASLQSQAIIILHCEKQMVPYLAVEKWIYYKRDIINMRAVTVN